MNEKREISAVPEALTRTALLLGDDAVRKLSACRVALFGLGGVGGYVLEALVRSGVGALDLIDNDRFAVSNLNRQILALQATLGRPKTEVAAERALAINPACLIRTYPLFFDETTAARFDFSAYDYVIDAIDSVSSKLLLIACCRAAGTPIISSMGTGGKMDPSKLKVADLFETSVCPLAKAMRHECRKRGIDKLKVVYSTEEPLAAMPASSAFVPSAAGLLLASEAVRDMIKA